MIRTLMSETLFVIVRSDFDKTYRLVQGMHGVAALTIKHSNHIENVEGFKDHWNNDRIVVLEATNEEMDYIHKRLVSLDMFIPKWASWREPDRHNEVTAIAFLEKDNPFKELRLT
jgi:hypothetical protein